MIAVLALDGVPGHQLTVPGLVFGAAAREFPDVAHEVRICTGPGVTVTGAPAPLRITTPWGLEHLAEADIVFLPGHDGYRDGPGAEVLEALRAAVARGGRIGAVGTGVFTLAATGLLDGRCATTGWRHTEELARRHPLIEVDPLGTAVCDGPCVTSAGVFGGLDVCLSFLRQDHGERVAGETSRELIAPLHTDADGVQERIDQELTDSAGLEPTIRWMEARLHLPLTLADIAAHAGISVSSLNRRFLARTGAGPLQHLLRIRLERARTLLGEGEEPVERIAERTGFRSAAQLRRHFGRLTGTTPRAYRAARRANASPRER
ncbi:helix-turn-helix domain-containing protein [Streptomyces jumonjinensis]|uniref:Helix-turn-helix domain-containing protein n=1 Tax=Streptomyces jumonjinensis TaxID=1945 RepID=A0A646KGF6_STRJU|nr:helix-turn-helix domain-containing protein [Streptomyces jumonjinensis]